MVLTKQGPCNIACPQLQVPALAGKAEHPDKHCTTCTADGLTLDYRTQEGVLLPCQYTNTHIPSLARTDQSTHATSNLEPHASRRHALWNSSAAQASQLRVVRRCTHCTMSPGW